MAKKDPFWKAMVELVRLKVKLSGPTIDHSGVVGVEGPKTQGCENVTAAPSGTLSNEPEPSSTSANTHDLIPVAAARLVVTFPAESWRTIPPPAPEEKLIEPLINAAWAADGKANSATSAIRGGMRVSYFWFLN